MRNTQWLDGIPASWIVSPAWSVFGERGEKSDHTDVHLTPSQTFGVLPQQEYMDRTGNRVVLNLAGQDNMKAVRKGDSIIHLRSFQGGIETSNLDGKVSTAYTVLSPAQNLAGNYFSYLLKSKAFIYELANLTFQLRDGQTVNYSRFARMYLPVPPRDVQQRIADYLDRETGEIDAMIAKMDELAGTLEARRRGSIEATFAAVIDKAPLWSLTDGIIDCPHTTPEVDDDGPAVAVRTSSVRSGRYVPGNGLKVSLETAKQRNGTVPPRRGDIFFTREAPAGEAALVPEGAFCLGQRMVLLRIDAEVTDARFLLHALYTTAVQEEFRLSAGGSTVVNLKLGTIRATQIPHAPLDEQKRIADHLDEVTSRIDQMLAKVADLKSLLIERRAALITDVVTGRKEVA